MAQDVAIRASVGEFTSHWRQRRLLLHGIVPFVLLWMQLAWREQVTLLLLLLLIGEGDMRVLGLLVVEIVSGSRAGTGCLNEWLSQQG